MKRIEFAPAARAELAAAVEQYEADYPGRGLRFAAAVARIATQTAATPHAGTAVPRIEAVAHTRKRPGYWVKGLPRK